MNETDITFKHMTASVSTDPLLTVQNTPEIAVCFGGFAPESNVVTIAIYAIGVFASVVILLLLVFALKRLTARQARPRALLGSSPCSLSMGGNPVEGSGNHKGDNIYIWEEFRKGCKPANESGNIRGNHYIQDKECRKGGNHGEGGDLHKGDNLYTQEDYDHDQSRKCLLDLGP
ncbi:uncharacterized protein LOC127865241 [Dreissena polymorpha]|uniref:Uncharacterized protein n=1 Tax=Dreissena polymorpha TaxID=45954 RepID=A0A9D4N3M6_DREPO|nr:uncharacterized protein LOC127865241 [Dreissena polymorpha]KAH3886684.1 hypothetical protein DPMN_010697 [Dreissena polymorpha]